MTTLVKRRCEFLYLSFISLFIVCLVYLLKECRTACYNINSESRTHTLRQKHNCAHSMDEDKAIKIRDFAKMIYKARLYSRSSKTSDLLSKSLNVLGELLIDLDIEDNFKEIVSRRTVESTEVCPEEYKGSLFGYPKYRKGFEVLNCSHGKPLSHMITIILDPMVFLDRPLASDQLKQISHFSFSLDENLSVIVPSYHEDAVSNYKNIIFVYVGDTSIGYKWNKLVKTARTKYVLIARGVYMLSSDIRLERLIREIGSQGVPIAGGATRDQKGYWRHGCKQSSFRNYSITYEDGYFESLHECIYCDHIDGPFVAERKIFDEIIFNMKLPDTGLFEDFFLQYNARFKEAIVCPDSMFFIQDTSNNSMRQWEPFAKQWDLYRLSINSIEMFFPCNVLYCRNAGHSNHPCCIKEMSICIKVIMQSCEEEGLFCEVQDGTLLGAVKFSKINPWDKDAEVTLGRANFTAFYNVKPKIEKAGCFMMNKAKLTDGKYKIKTKHWNLEAWNSVVLTPENVRDGLKPTKVFLDGLWMTSPPNPGLFSRNRFGHEMYRHAQDWTDLRHENSFANYKPSTFTKCFNPPRQSCLDQYNIDGSLQFSDPVP